MQFVQGSMGNWQEIGAAGSASMRDRYDAHMTRTGFQAQHHIDYGIIERLSRAAGGSGGSTGRDETDDEFLRRVTHEPVAHARPAARDMSRRSDISMSRMVYQTVYEMGGRDEFVCLFSRERWEREMRYDGRVVTTGDSFASYELTVDNVDPRTVRVEFKRRRR